MSAPILQPESLADRVVRAVRAHLAADAELRKVFCMVRFWHSILPAVVLWYGGKESWSYLAISGQRVYVVAMPVEAGPRWWGCEL